MKKSIFIAFGLGFLILQSCKKDYECTITTQWYATDGPFESIEVVNYYGITKKEKKSIEEPFTDNSPKIFGDITSRTAICVEK